MTKPELILIGAGGHSHACIDVIDQQNKFSIAGLVGKPDELNDQHLGYAVIASDNELDKLVNEYQYAFIAIGQISSPFIRIQLYKKVCELGFQVPGIISPSAYVSRHATINPGTIIMHDAIINAGARVGLNCIINTRALIEHDSIVDNYCHISTGAIINGDVNIGKGSFIGSGSVIKQGISIGKDCVVGMGLSVRHNLADKTKFVGNF